MKFETIIIGAGLAGVSAAIRLAEQGKDVALISAGRSAMHFNSGSLGLLGFDNNHQPVSSPVEAVESLPDSHPYKRLEAASLTEFADNAADLLRRAGVKTVGNVRENHMRITPLGLCRPAWLTLEQVVTLDTLKQLERPHVAIVGIAGFLDFYPRFIAAALEKEGFRCDLLTVDNPDLQRLRKSETEMRAANIARIMEGDALTRFGESVRDVSRDSEAAALILPAVVNFDGDGESLHLRQIVGRDLFYAPTMGVSIPGIAMHTRLMRHFLSLGGRLFNGHRVISAEFNDDSLVAVYTDKLDDDALRADNFIFAGGSFFSRGLVATPDEVIEPIFNLDTLAPSDRSKWFDSDLFGVQPVMNSGIAVDHTFRTLRSGVPVKNLYAVGSSLAGADSLSNDSGAGVALLTAIAVADRIIKLQ